MNPKIRLEFDGGYLQPLCTEDVNDRYLEGINDPEVNQFLVGVKIKHQNRETLEKFISENENSSNSVLFGIWIDGQQDFSGTVRVHNIEYVFRTAHIGICLFDKTAWGYGVGHKAIFTVTKWCHKSLELRWVEAGTYDENIASKSCFLKAGYEWVADIKDKYLLDGRNATINIYAAKNL